MSVKKRNSGRTVPWEEAFQTKVWVNPETLYVVFCPGDMTRYSLTFIKIDNEEVSISLGHGGVQCWIVTILNNFGKSYSFKTDGFLHEDYVASKLGLVAGMGGADVMTELIGRIIGRETSFEGALNDLPSH